MEKHLCEHGMHSSQQIRDQEIWTLSSVLTLSVQWENCSPLGQVPILKRQLIWPLLSGTPDSFITSFSVEHTGASAQNQSKGQPQSLRAVTYGNSKNLDMLFLNLSNFKPLNKHPKAALKPPHQMHPHMDYLQTWEALQLSRIEGLGFFKKKTNTKTKPQAQHRRKKTSILSRCESTERSRVFFLNNSVEQFTQRNDLHEEAS